MPEPLGADGTPFQPWLRMNWTFGEIDPAFNPSSLHDILVSIFTWWNLLDTLQRIHVQKGRSSATFAPGHLKEIQLHRMIRLVREPGTSNYCEVGMNVGHSTVAMLVANPQITAHVFDLGAFRWSEPVATLLRAHFGHRFQLYVGKSRHTIPKWRQAFLAAGRRCDLFLIDGDHRPASVIGDLRAMYPAADVQRNYVVIDDTQSHVMLAVQNMTKAGQLRVLEAYGPYPKHTPPLNPSKWRWGYIVGSYSGMEKR